MNTLRVFTNAGETRYDVDFDLGYLDKAHIYVYAGEDHTLYETQLTYIWVTPTEIELTEAGEYSVGTKINVRRVVPQGALYVTFQNAIGLTDKALNSGNAQALMILEEVSDGFKGTEYYEKQDLNLGGFKIVNMADGVGGTDAVTMSQFNIQKNITGDDVVRCEAAADAAEISRWAAEAAETSATQSALNAEAAANALTITVYREVIGVGGKEVFDSGLQMSADAPNVQLEADGINQYDAFPCDAGGLATTGLTTYVNAGSVLPEGVEVRITVLTPDALPDITDALGEINVALDALDDSYALATALLPFNTVADMLAANLLVGGAYETLGYYEIGDGGGGRYLIKSAIGFGGTPDEYGNLTVNTDDVAVLQHKGTINIKQYGATGDGTTDDYAAIQATIDSGVSSIYIPSGTYVCLTSINLCNLAVTGRPLKIFGDAVAYDEGGGSVIKSNPGTGGWCIEAVGTQFLTIEDIMIVSTGVDSAGGGILFARSVTAGFAQNNALRRVIIKIATGGGTIALGNNCAEQFVCDECWLEADVPYVATLANESGFVSQFTTIANVIFSNTAHSFRLTTFTPLTSTSMILQGIGTATFDNCVWIPIAGNVHPYGITLRSSLQAYQDCQNITITGQVESFVSAIRCEGNTRDLKVNISTSSVTGVHVQLFSATTHYNPSIRTNPFNNTGVSVVGSAGGLVTVYGGSIVVAPNLTLVDVNVLLLGTDVDGGNSNMASSSSFSVASGSSFKARWYASFIRGSVDWTPGTIVTGGPSVATVFAVSGVAIGDKVDVYWPYTSAGCVAVASVESAGNVRVTILNFSGFNQSLPLGTWRVVCERPTY